jgi:hypothetical protein
MPPHVQGQAAALLGFSDNKTGPIEFKLRLKVCKKRSHSQWRGSLGTEAGQGAGAFFAKLLSELQERAQ